MASIINADNGVVSGSAGLKTSADSTGVLALQTNGTTALTVNASQALGVGSTPSFGTSGQVLTSAGLGAPPTWATVGGGGKVLQVVQGTKSGSTFTTSATYSTSNVFATITPTLSTSKVMVIASSPCSLQTGQLKIALYRGTSGNGSGSQVVEIGNGNVSAQVLGTTVNWLDSPASTSALSYTIMQQSTNGSSLVGFVSDFGGTASILLLEIGA